MIQVVCDDDVLADVQDAVVFANEVLHRPEFYNGIRERPSFTLTKVPPATIAQLMQDASLKFEVKVYTPKRKRSKTLAYTAPEHPNRLFLNGYKLKEHIGWEKQHFIQDVAATIVHECVHALDQSLPDYSFGHGDNKRKSKSNTAPYWIGNHAFRLLVGLDAPILAFDRVSEEEPIEVV